MRCCMLRVIQDYFLAWFINFCLLFRWHHWIFKIYHPRLFSSPIHQFFFTFLLLIWPILPTHLKFMKKIDVARHTRLFSSLIHQFLLTFSVTSLNLNLSSSMEMIQQPKVYQHEYEWLHRATPNMLQTKMTLNQITPLKVYPIQKR